MLKKLIKIIILISLCFIIGYAGSPVEMKLHFGGQSQNVPYRAEEAKGLAVSAELDRALSSNIDLFLNVAYDQAALEEDSVLLEWDWPYWDERYIDWLLTGASVEEVDSISTVLEYWRPDSSYHGLFFPYQTLKELRISAGLNYNVDVNSKLSLYGALSGGISLYERRLKMVEDWTKVFSWEWDSLAVAEATYSEDEMENYNRFMELHQQEPGVYALDTLDGMYTLTYDYNTTVTHFAPNKTGFKMFLSPRIGLRYALAGSVDLDMSYQSIIYLNVVDLAEKKETFPITSKSMIWLGLTFKY